MSLCSFREAFHGLLPLNKREAGGRLRACGGMHGVGIDLLLAQFNADFVQCAALQLSYVDGSDEFDVFSLRCLRSFVSVILGDPAAAEAWLTATFQHLKAAGVTSCTTAHDGFSLSLLQQKPYQMFLITATDEDGIGEARG